MNRDERVRTPARGANAPADIWPALTVVRSQTVQEVM